MRDKGYEIKLKAKEIKQLEDLIKKGSEKARKLARARILLLSHKGKSQKEIAEVLSITAHTVRNICLRFLEEGLESALNEKPRPGQPSIFDGKQKAKITALACSEPPEGYSQWSLRLLADKAVELKIVENISHTNIAEILKKMKLNRT